MLHISIQFSLLFSVLVFAKCQVLNLTVGRSRDQVLQRAYWKNKDNKTGTRQCTRAVWSTFADIHSTHPGALMHYLGSLEFPVRILDASDITTHTRPT